MWDYTSKDSVSLEMLLPPKSFLTDYMEFVRQSEIPKIFHIAVAMGVLGAVMGRMARCNRGYYDIYPNLSFIMVGNSGTMKSSAMRIGRDILRRAQDTNLKVIKDKATLEGIIKALPRDEKVTRAIIFSSELSVLIGKEKYLQNMIPNLTDLLDTDISWNYLTESRGEIVFPNPTITLIGASNPAWLMEMLPVSAFTGGLMYRVVLVGAKETEEPLPFVEKVPEEEWQKLAESLSRCVPQKEIEIVVEPGAREEFSRWYKFFKKTFKSDETISGYFSRKPDLVLRIAMLFQLAGRNSTITKEALSRALAFLRWLEPLMKDVMTGVFTTALGKDHSFVLELLRQHKIIGRAELVRKTFHKLGKVQLQGILEHLKDSELVDRYVDGRKEFWKVIGNEE